MRAHEVEVATRARQPDALARDRQIAGSTPAHALAGDRQIAGSTPTHALARDRQIAGIDISARMLKRAKERVEDLSAGVDLAQMDAERLGFPDGTFDAAVATFVFCSVPDAVRGLKEVNRVVKPGGRVVFLEHVPVNAPVIGPLMDLLDPVALRPIGPHINRRMVENVTKAGLEIERVDELTARGLVKLILARSS